MMENIGENTQKLRVAEKKALMKKVTIHLGKILRYYIEVNGWTAREIYDQTGVPQNRLTEIQNYEKYQRPINDLNLKLFVGGGMINVEQLLDKLELTEKEKLYLETFKMHEDKALSKYVLKAAKRGFVASEIIKKFLDEN